MDENSPPVRINKILARAGLCSRRRADERILAGEVSLNGEVVRDPGSRARRGDVLRVGDREFAFGPLTDSPHLYLLLNKPVRVVSTLRDPQGRETLRDLLPRLYADKRLFPVGRLDFFSEGFLLMTNDGELTRRLTHPGFHVPKYYELLARGPVSEEQLERMRGGMTLAEGERLAPLEVERAEADADCGRGWGERGVFLRLTLKQGVNRQIRRMCRDLGLTVLRLRRVGQGPLRLGGLRPGECRELSPEEALELKKAAGMKPSLRAFSFPDKV
ncbi:MAG: rRNA pseudouridine synthase [Deltaproteobacteria bacterium]|jgi:23S rRNA pseudouridine2605 synthase|nr:rRNA pseudouridine synthase [Deltaproteobacteria bacterium]